MLLKLRVAANIYYLRLKEIEELRFDLHLFYFHQQWDFISF